MHPTFDIHKILETIGPTASLLFAAWIFLQYLNQRFTESLKRLRELAENLRTATQQDERRESLCSQIGLYRRRCGLMRIATNIGLVAAVLLLATLTLAAVTTIFAGPPVLEAVAVCCSVVGLLLVAVATVIVILENRLVEAALHSELSDLHLPDGR